MTVEVYVIKDCMYCTNFLRELPKLVKEYPGVTFAVTCVDEEKTRFEMFPTVVVDKTVLSPCIYVSEVRDALT